MQHNVFLGFLPFFLLLFAGCNENEAPKSFPTEPALLAELRADLVSDRRTDRFEVSWISGEAGVPDTINGYTTLPGAVARMKREWENNVGGEVPVVHVRTLPDSAVGELRFGLVRVSVANLRSKPGHSQELATQALLGSPLQLLDFRDGWYLVRTPDRYLAWLEEGALTRLDSTQLMAWYGDELYYSIAPATFVYSAPGSGNIVTDLVAGNLVQTTGRAQSGWIGVKLPDGTTGWVERGILKPYETWANPDDLSIEQLLTTASSLAGRPYLWGGTSSKGMDCSGFTKMTYYMNGYVIPRDASQQVHAGTPVSLDNNFSSLRAGDLLFFGNYRADGSERISHVGCYLGAGRFVHSGADNGRITINSLLPEDELFAAHRLESLMRAKRLSPGTSGVQSIEEAFKAIISE